MILDLLIALVGFCHLIVCPFTKVEESFNVQAIHDLLYHRFNVSQYDHLEFPGVVPRTFVGPIIVSGLCAIPAVLCYLAGINKLITQYIARAVLGLLVIVAFRRFRRSVNKEFGKSVSIWLTLITISQFHFPFYMTRPLPNIFSLILVLLAISFWLRKEHRNMIITTAFVVIVFRAEVAILFGLIILVELLSRRLSLLFLLKWGIPAGLASLGMTIAIDSFFWQRLVWPEGEVLYFNIVLNKSAEWGTAPWLWYFYSALPRALSSSIILVPVGLFIDKRLGVFLFPPVAFLIVYSFLPHKELRFIIYVIPMLNVAVAAACKSIWQNKDKSILRKLLAVFTAGHLVMNCISTSLLLYVSHYNYPGGVALQQLHLLERQTKNVNIHIDDLSAQTGVSRFGEINSNWIYNKSEGVSSSSEMIEFTHLLIEGKSKFSSTVHKFQDTHRVISSVEAFSHLKFDYDKFPPVRIRTKPKILILKRI